jgi:hypothetical protein
MKKNVVQVGLLSNSIRYLSSKAQTEGLSTHERELLKGQLLALELFIARLNLPQQQQFVADLLGRHTTTTAAAAAAAVAVAFLADDRPASPSSEISSFDEHHDHHGHRHHHHDHLGVMSVKAHKKRAKRTFNRACVHCGTQFTSQWRKGPAGASTYVFFFFISTILNA